MSVLSDYAVMLSPAIAVAGVVVGAWLNHSFTVRRKQAEDLAAYRFQAYTDLINGVSRVAAARRTGRTSDELDELVALNDAKTRICVCGEPAVVAALAEFWKRGATLEEESALLGFNALCQEMRKSMGSGPLRLPDGLRLSDTLFKVEPSKHSYKAGNKDELHRCG